MKIAIQAADLDWPRIDGTRVYILNILCRFGEISPADEFLIYHRKNFNPELTPPNFPNYKIKKIRSPLFWTQTRFALELAKDKPDALWMPMHNIPLLKSKYIKTTVTIHDLAFRIFPEHFLKSDLAKLKILTSLAVKNADKIIAVSQSSKRDILKYYPQTPEEKIRVIYHGFDEKIYGQERNTLEENEVKRRLGIKGDYIIYSGAIQPRKNLITLIESFEIFKRRSGWGGKLILAGGKAWQWRKIYRRALQSPVRADIILSGRLKFDDLGHLIRGAKAYVFPSLYEGFGITVLEAMASQVPVISSANSSLPEVGGEAVLYFNNNDAGDLAKKIEMVINDKNLADSLVRKGREQIKKFSWDKCARETLEWIRE